MMLQVHKDAENKLVILFNNKVYCIQFNTKYQCIPFFPMAQFI